MLPPIELPGWGRYPLRDRLSEATGFPALLDKDVTAAVVAERWTGVATDSRNLLFFYLGTGSGMGLVVEDTVLRGVSGNAGEVGGLGAAAGRRHHRVRRTAWKPLADRLLPVIEPIGARSPFVKATHPTTVLAQPRSLLLG
ncbi:ROK family protein [Streptomyces sp. NPDC056660]|uniref:ROK family protein n=1 Tax=Streptomyces sp. NPDC056660 TaxID=3345897 RepID=UPI0036CD2782